MRTRFWTTSVGIIVLLVGATFHFGYTEPKKGENELQRKLRLQEERLQALERSSSFPAHGSAVVGELARGRTRSVEAPLDKDAAQDSQKDGTRQTNEGERFQPLTQEEETEASRFQAAQLADELSQDGTDAAWSRATESRAVVVARELSFDVKNVSCGRTFCQIDIRTQANMEETFDALIGVEPFNQEAWGYLDPQADQVATVYFAREGHSLPLAHM